MPDPFYDANIIVREADCELDLNFTLTNKRIMMSYPMSLGDARAYHAMLGQGIERLETIHGGDGSEALPAAGAGDDAGALQEGTGDETGAD